MSRLKRVGWSMVPGWVTYLCSLPCDSNDTPCLTAEHAAVAGCLISYSFWKKCPITPNYQQVANSVWGPNRGFKGETVGQIEKLISDLIDSRILFRTTDGKIMPGLAARRYEKDSATREFWEPLRMARAVDELIVELDTDGSPGAYLDLSD